MSKTYTARYGGKPCRALTSDDRWFTVLLDQDPGYGSMIFSRIYRSEVELLAEVAEDVTR